MNLQLDKANAALLGVCAGVARAADVDPVLVRIATVLVAVFLAPIVLPAYLYAGLTWKAAPPAASVTILYYRHLQPACAKARCRKPATWERKAA